MTIYNYEELRAEDWPFCDLCDEPMDDEDGIEADWNGETGNHESCEADPDVVAQRMMLRSGQSVSGPR